MSSGVEAAGVEPDTHLYLLNNYKVLKTTWDTCGAHRKKKAGIIPPPAF
jgi:hypothetical protein